MCGITGFYSSKLNSDHLEKMTSSLKHRGPDANGIFFEMENNIGLGHRRLSILDPTLTANQPMVSHCRRYSMVYNGEVYNFKSVAKQLSRRWKTNSDSEVLLEAYVEYGLDFISKFNGMFALAIYDHFNKELILARDRMGIKPLYYYIDDKEFIFASEIKAIKSICSLDVNKNAIQSYLHLGYVSKDETF